MRKTKYWTALVLCLLLLTGCQTDAQADADARTDAQKFKEEYELLNGEDDPKGNTLRSVSFAEDNPMVYAEYQDIIDRMDNGETFVVYFGFASCPWCRACLGPFLDCAAECGIETVYYVDLFNNRDIIEFNENNEPEQTKVGSDAYYALMDKLDNVLDEYMIDDLDPDTDEKYDTGEKRIYAPNFIAVVDGEAVAMEESGELMEDASAELTPEILEELAQCYTALFELVQ